MYNIKVKGIRWLTDSLIPGLLFVNTVAEREREKGRGGRVRKEERKGGKKEGGKSENKRASNLVCTK